MAEPIYKELSYKLVGIAFEVYKTLGDDLNEKTYANAFEQLLKREAIDYRREIYYPIRINGNTIGKQFFDFSIEGKIIIELKTGNFRYYQAYSQLLNYLKISKLKLGLIIRFTRDGVKTKRIINIK